MASTLSEQAAPRAPTSHKRLLVPVGVAMLAFGVVIYLLDVRMRHAGGPTILGFEFAASHTRAVQILNEWGQKGRAAARLSLWIDYGYMLSYGAFFTLAGLSVRGMAQARGWSALAAVGRVAPYLAAVAALFDASENVALLLTLGGHGGSFAPPFATVCSSIKFLCIAIAIVYTLWGLVRWLGARPRRA
jgi:hypothetical protein